MSSRYPGLASLAPGKYTKYRNAEFSKIYGGKVRRLSAREIEEFRAGVEGRSPVLVRRAVV